MQQHKKSLVLATIIFAAGVTQAAVGSPNIVLFLVDDMGWTDWQHDAVLNPTGSVVYETPNMLRLAQSGKVFQQAYSASPLCSPTRAAIMTGKSPARTRISDFIPGTNNNTTNLSQPNWTMNLPTGEVTLAESLNAAGYITGFFGKWHLGQSGNTASDPLQNGFHVNVGGGPFGNPGGSNGGFFAGSDGMWARMPGLNTPGQFPSDKYLSDALNEQAVTFIDSQAGGPFFLMMSHYLVHTPIQAPTALVNKYTQKIASLQSQGVDVKDHDNATYAAMVEKMDESLGNLLDRLEDPDGDGNQRDSIRDNTIIMFTSDNGGLWSSEGSPTRNLPLREGKGSMYEGGIRIPFIVSWIGNSAVTQGVVSETRISSHDIYPTLLDIAGIRGDSGVPQNTDIDGLSFAGALEREVFDRGYQFWHYPHVSPQDNYSSEISGGKFVSAVRKGDWKLLFFYDDRHYELYNLATDMSETSNVLQDNADVALDLSRALHNHLVAVNAQMPINNSTGQPVDPPQILLSSEGGNFNGESREKIGAINGTR